MRVFAAASADARIWLTWFCRGRVRPLRLPRRSEAAEGLLADHGRWNARGQRGGWGFGSGPARDAARGDGEEDSCGAAGEKFSGGAMGCCAGGQDVVDEQDVAAGERGVLADAGTRRADSGGVGRVQT